MKLRQGFACILLFASMIFSLGWITNPAQAASSAAADRLQPCTNFIAGNFHSYVLSLNWEPEFCQTNAGKATVECRTIASERFDANNLGLHGLWPTKAEDAKYEYGYCNIPCDRQQLDRDHRWSQLGAVALAESTQRLLEKYMPGYASQLDRHEWVRHGSCSLLDMNEYFSLAVDLTAQVAATRFNQFIAAHIGQHFNVEDFYAAVEQDFGPASRRYVRLGCNKDVPSNLIQVTVSLRKEIAKGTSIKNALGPFIDSNSTNCESTIFVSPALPPATSPK